VLTIGNELVPKPLKSGAERVTYQKLGAVTRAEVEARARPALDALENTLCAPRFISVGSDTAPPTSGKNPPAHMPQAQFAQPQTGPRNAGKLAPIIASVCKNLYPVAGASRFNTAFFGELREPRMELAGLKFFGPCSS
jgi:hypothetical protein